MGMLRVGRVVVLLSVLSLGVADTVVPVIAAPPAEQLSFDSVPAADPIDPGVSKYSVPEPPGVCAAFGGDTGSCGDFGDGGCGRGVAD